MNNYGTQNHMKVGESDAPMLGQYVKLRKIGEIAELMSYDPKSQMLDIKLPAGRISVHRREIDVIIANEELEFLLSHR